MPYPNAHRRIHSVNEEFFESLNRTSAYVFGFWMADGTMHHDRHYKISFSSKDLDHLEKVKKAISASIEIYHEKRGGFYTNCYELYVYSKKMFMDVINLGGQTRKSNFLTFPRLPKELLADFMRGYFDGDGSVHYVKYSSTKNNRHYNHIEMRSNFTCGSKKFLLATMNILRDRLGLAKKVIGQYGPHQFKLGYGQKDTYKLLNFMYYPNHNISLERKRVYLDKIKISP
jgi:hypothetical protein